LVGDGGGRVKPLSIQVQLTPQHGIYVYTWCVYVSVQTLIYLDVHTQQILEKEWKVIHESIQKVANRIFVGGSFNESKPKCILSIFIYETLVITIQQLTSYPRKF
jgi:hypothetical protein